AGMINTTQVIIKESFEIEKLTIAKASLRSIIYNLISNAIKYHSPKRPPHINISTYQENDYTILSIKDNGLGLNNDQQAKLFHMFKRFHSHVEGTGIGLYIVKRTMDNINGKIKIESRLNEGTELKLYFKNND
ncbi:ATP-binding protein, partial [Cesiribacter sp. SM1]|uniref:sensor histidine kinase n=1 Tax=Cesiribacter sp. SM1 TaxID=2861196 RepID=UPI001CD60284